MSLPNLYPTMVVLDIKNEYYQREEEIRITSIYVGFGRSSRSNLILRNYTFKSVGLQRAFDMY